ncbi:Rho-binding antiterminator [Pseudomonas sp. GD03944]|uniref:Rho-binding antiterminator n=1 Tax=Pseudomonas sp. GD03944 TaxID=2975409 RepID=UPI002447BE42|nr:Rho-binding antiterminator [Pseudomonas sp. GD03944]MDH1265836.1 Rho-binding antiterminator [Pseudomonas sp. GD03944]HWV10970.1 Rho-binding antiterminator [Pseudomonas sp.]
MSDDYQPLACALYDYLEVACLHHYRLHIELVDGGTLDAEALTTETRASKEEFLVVRSDQGEQHLRMDQMIAVTPLTPGARFGRVLLNNRAC